MEVPECTVAQAIEKVNCEDRDELQVSAKLFIIGLNSSSVRDAVDTAFSALGVAQLDSVIIAPPPTEDRNSLSEYLQPSLQELESLVQNKKIVTIHTSDFDKTPLERVYVWAQVKQSSNQVNRAAGCVMPLDLTALAKQVNIQLLTEIMTQKNYFVKQVSKKFFGKASRISKRTNGFLYGFSNIQSLLKAESSPDAISCKIKDMPLKTLSSFFFFFLLL